MTKVTEKYLNNSNNAIVIIDEIDKDGWIHLHIDGESKSYTNSDMFDPEKWESLKKRRVYTPIDTKAMGGPVSAITKADITVGAKFKNKNGTILIIDSITGNMVSSSIVDKKEKYKDELPHLVSFLNLEGCVKVMENGGIVTAQDGEITQNGKRLGNYEFDRDSDAFWIEGKSLETKDELIAYVKANPLKADTDFDEYDMGEGGTINPSIWKHNHMDATAEILSDTAKGYKVKFTDNTGKKPKITIQFFDKQDFKGDRAIFTKIMAEGGGVENDEQIELWFAMDSKGNVKNISTKSEDVKTFIRINYNRLDGGKTGYVLASKKDWLEEKISIANIKNYKLAKGGAIPKFDKLPKNRQANKKYTHFAVAKTNGKIVNGWETISDVETLKYYTKGDLKDNFPDNKFSDFKIVSGKHLIRNGINPYDFDNWLKTGETFEKGGNIKSVIDYEIDADTTVGPDGLENIVWIEIKGVKPEAFKEIEANYEAFAKPFEVWAEKYGFYPVDISTTDDSMSFTLNLGKASRMKIEKAHNLLEASLLEQDFITDLVDHSSQPLYAKGGNITPGYKVFNYTDDIYASPDTFRTKKEAKEFIAAFRKRFDTQGYYRDNRGRKLKPAEIDLEIIPEDFSPFRKMANGGPIKSTVLTKDGIEVEKGTQKYKGHVFFDEKGGKYTCMGYFPKLDDCVYMNEQTKLEVTGCMDGFYFNNPTKVYDTDKIISDAKARKLKKK